VDEEVNRDKNGQADGMNLEIDSKDEVMQPNSTDDGKAGGSSVRHDAEVRRPRAHESRLSESQLHHSRIHCARKLKEEKQITIMNPRRWVNPTQEMHKH